MKYFKIIIIVLSVLTGQNIIGQEISYPSGSNIQYYYAIEDSSVIVGDTIYITRQIINNSSDTLSCFYFSDCFPSDFTVTSHSSQINSSDVTYLLQTAASGSVVLGYTTYHWIFDSPDISESVNQKILPDDTVELSVNIVCQTPGNYELPFHTAVMSSSSVGRFSTSGSKTIIVENIAVSIDEDDDWHEMPDYFTSKAFPNPFNSSVSILLEGSININELIILEIYDILGRLISKSTYTNLQNNSLQWDTDNKTGSGLYFYRVKTNSHTSAGKLMLLK